MIQRAKALGVPITLHAGESTELAEKNVQIAIDDYGASRIEHGCRIVENDTLLSFVKKCGCHVEICPTSSVETDGWKFKDFAVENDVGAEQQDEDDRQEENDVGEDGFASILDGDSVLETIVEEDTDALAMEAWADGKADVVEGRKHDDLSWVFWRRNDVRLSWLDPVLDTSSSFHTAKDSSDIMTFPTGLSLSSSRTKPSAQPSRGCLQFLNIFNAIF